eukprot:TRINITY_DN33975_c0_g1_i1.p1 TRINITY_DN33975_c0_g1~~TRINITY_DN33975_c0_g1_i1.p1  ORF type:complete len:1024 (-),score=239.94 TRINITY_DN33975_c0_g1_i1:389-3010(-)
MVDQTTLGHKFLMEEFGIAPKTGWQLDPFGHSATQAALLSSEVGFNGLFFGRIDYQDLAKRINTSSAEFVWRASPSLGDGTQIFSGLTGSYDGNYNPPPGFCWDGLSAGHSCNDETFQDDPRLRDYNVKSRIDDFVNFATWQANRTRGKHVLWTMGSDFQYENAREWYTNLDKLVKYANLDGRVKAIYSTPERYVQAKLKEKDTVSWPLKTGDFFPYADGPHKFWTGYFTSRPALKRYVRDTSAFLQVVRQVSTLAGKPSQKSAEGLEKLSEEVAVLQHHDAVAGTAKQHVTFDYASRLAESRTDAMPAVNEGLEKLLKQPEGVSFQVCDLRNVSLCAPTQALQKENDEVSFVLWNGLAQVRKELVELPIAHENVHVASADGTEMLAQVVPSLPAIDNYGKPIGGSQLTLLFEADLPAMGYRTFKLTSHKRSEKRSSVDVYRWDGADDVAQNDHIALKFCDGLLCAITDKASGTTTKATQNWYWYNASEGDQISSQASGAYIFRPETSDPNAHRVYTGKPLMTIVTGALATEVHQTFGPWVNQRIRLARDSSHAEMTYTVGAIPIEDNRGKEVVSRFTTDIQNAGSCFTDSNGREMLPRKHNYRHYWNLSQTEEVAGNYFPVTTAHFIRDDKAQLTVLTETSQAGSGCVHDGQLELMVHRRLLKDDRRGVGEPLNETKYITSYVSDPKGQHYGPGLVVRGKHLVSLAPPAKAAEAWRPLQDKFYMPPAPFFAAGNARLKEGSYSALSDQLPANVQVITLDRWDDKRLLVRLAHQFGLGEDAELSKPATVDLSKLFANRRLVSVDERGLAATISREEVLKRRNSWHIDGEAQPVESSPDVMHGFTTTLGPLQIRTFFLNFAEDDASEATLTFFT